MDKWRFFTFIFLLLYVVDNCAMQQEKSDTNLIRSILLPRPVSIIMRCDAPQKIRILHLPFSTIWDCNVGECVTSLFNATNLNESRIYFHPRSDKLLSIFDSMDAAYIDCSDTERSFHHCYSGLFSQQESVLYISGNKCLVRYDYRMGAPYSLKCNVQLGTLFECPSANQRQPYFLCSDFSHKIMYKITLTEKNTIFAMQKMSIKKLFDFPFDVDLSSWVYCAQEKLFFFINNHDRRMYCFNIKGIKKHKVPNKMYLQNEGFPDESFPVGAIKLHPNKRVLILLSEERDIIQYVDIKTYDTVRHLKTTTHEPFGYDQYSAQKMAVSLDGVTLLLAAGRECQAIEIPLEVREISFLEKSIMQMVCEQSGIPKDVRKLLWYFLINVLKKE